MKQQQENEASPSASGFKWRGEHQYGQEWRRQAHRYRGPSNPRKLFIRFVALFGGMILLVAGGMAVLAALLTTAMGGGRPVAFLVWMGGCGLALALPLAAVLIARSAFRRTVTPLAGLMTAIRAVSEGDLSARVKESGGEFGQLGQAFNQMVIELERSDQQRRNLTADVAHELRTPLHIIQGNLEGIVDGIYEPSSGHIEATLEETHALARLIDDLQTLSLAETGQLHLIKEQVDIQEVLEDVRTSFGGQAETAGLELVIEPSPGSLPAVWGDTGRLNQVLSILVMNALRHTPAGGRVVLSAFAENGDVAIVVKDTGEGIPADDLPFVFDRFWRGDRARTSGKGAGAGLGLAIARQLVQAHGGSVSVSSTPGHFTEFTIILPVEPERE